MGMFDELPGGQQVKCWFNTGMIVRRGQEVPTGAFSHYQVALREGGFAQVRHERFMFISKRRRNVPMFDKWGEQIEDIPEGYLFKDWRNDPMVKDIIASRAEEGEDDASSAKKV